VLSVYPTQLYEVAMGLAIFLIVWRLRDHRHAEGWLFGPYAVLAGIERFIVEFYRAKDDRLLAGLTYAQVIAIGFIVLGVIWMAVFWRVREKWPGIYGARPEAPLAPSPAS
jgi:phosphatidylglycerol:prolipoprotein diacylglycerol transferase